MTKLVLGAGIGGLLVGLLLSAYAHSENGFLTGPAILFGLAISIAGGLGAVFLLVIGKRSPAVYGLASFSVAMLCALLLLPLVWPYAAASKPVPLSSM